MSRRFAHLQPLAIRWAAAAQLALLIAVVAADASSSGSRSLLPAEAPASVPVHYYCDTPGRDYINRPVDFYLYTRPNGSSDYRPGSRCAFHAITQSPGAVYFVQLLNVSMPTANLTIVSDRDVLLSIGRGVEPPEYATALTTPRATVTVSFAADADDSAAGGVGAVIRVRLFTACPPGWTAVGGFCFGNAGGGSGGSGGSLRQLTFPDSQAACRLMRANLLHLPPGLPGIATITDLFRHLPGELASNNWIGVTDNTNYGQFNYRWLDGSQFYESNLIGCRSSLLGNNRNCKLEERCCFFYTHLLYLFRYIVMDQCSSKRSYTCFMPTGGATTFYSVPAYSLFSTGAWVWAIVIGCLFAIGVAIGVVYAVLRLLNSRRSSTPGKN